MLIDKSQLLGITAPEMTVLLGGMRSLGISYENNGVLTDSIGKLSNDFFINLLSMSIEWKPVSKNKYEAIHRETGEKTHTASRVDLVFGSNSQLRAISEVYACADSGKTFIKDFISAWVKVMNFDRFDLE